MYGNHSIKVPNLQYVKFYGAKISFLINGVKCKINNSFFPSLIIIIGQAPKCIRVYEPNLMHVSKSTQSPCTYYECFTNISKWCSLRPWRYMYLLFISWKSLFLDHTFSTKHHPFLLSCKRIRSSYWRICLLSILWLNVSYRGEYDFCSQAFHYWKTFSLR